MKVILSCTTTFEREKLFYHTFLSLSRQSLKPDLFLINISHQSYLSDSGFDEAPQWLKEVKGSNVKINWVENTGPYRKLIPAIEFAEDEDVIVTADDDVLYHEEWLKMLVNASQENLNSIIAGRARQIKKNIYGDYQNYANWDNLTTRKKGIDILPVGCGGVLYKKPFLDINFLLDESFLQICPKTDDLWFKYAGLRKQTPVLCIPKIEGENIYFKHNKGLQNTNIGGSKLRSTFASRLLSLPLIKHIHHKITVKIMNYLGVNRSNNDENWDKINGYSKDAKSQQRNY